jgi:predicted nuclease with TOPRIM domain
MDASEVEAQALHDERRARVRALLAREEGYVGELQALRDENERLTLADRQWADHVKRLSEKNERLRAALSEIMQGARSLDYAIHVARVALASDG